NAGYLLVAGSEQLPGVEPVEPYRRRRTVAAWIPVGALAAAILLFGTIAGIGTQLGQTDQKERLVREQEEKLVRQERAQRDKEKWEAHEGDELARRREQGKEIVGLFRE